MSRFKVNTPPTNFPEERDTRLSLFKKKNDKNLFNMVDAENIKLSGSRVKVFEYIPSEDIDDVYQESRQKTIAQEAVTLWAHYDPRPFEVFEVQEDSFEAYGVYHLMVHAKLLRDTQDIHNEDFFDSTEKIGSKY